MPDNFAVNKDYPHFTVKNLCIHVSQFGIDTSSAKPKKNRETTYCEKLTGYDKLFYPMPYFDKFAYLVDYIQERGFKTPMQAVCAAVGSDKNNLDLWRTCKENKIEILCSCRTLKGVFKLKDIYLRFESAYMKPFKSLYYDKKGIDMLKEYACIASLCGGGTAYITASVICPGYVVSMRHIKCTLMDDGSFKLKYNKSHYINKIDER
ncbi:MAG: hypothetical protein IPL70_09050 [Uliginosibacterium sp.]|nr:hypothetical protein [Uliginosibacterium sp.]